MVTLVLIAASMLQLLIYLLCHPSWPIRKAAYEATKRIVAAVPQASEALLNEFATFLSAVSQTQVLKSRYDLLVWTCFIGYSSLCYHG